MEESNAKLNNCNNKKSQPHYNIHDHTSSRVLKTNVCIVEPVIWYQKKGKSHKLHKNLNYLSFKKNNMLACTVSKTIKGLAIGNKHHFYLGPDETTNRRSKNKQFGEKHDTTDQRVFQLVLSRL